MPLDAYSAPDRPQKKQLIVFWILWFALLQGVLVLYFLLKEKTQPGATLPPLVPLAPFLLGMVLRWLVLPRFKTLKKALTVYVLGLSMCEGTALLGLFIGGEHRDVLVALGLLGLALNIPLFAAKLKNGDDQNHTR